ncbi:alpha/beta hydrolase [Pseudonocardia abyssalis]|uniref:Esterase n=1 Tax=Pseudonocardia abyssalis TaxID=2792008 RepID=A0ABS6ULR6_9PSEU|nr:alpha/beta hydrolase-fold protein [Pseudonocardia abyssalis]MBW0115076.1 esterase [Pseudonocardia abyssalis]MBW0133171.1 esterase [Pseudonocardia abyssalis]
MDWSLVDGALPVALSLAGAAALLALLLLGGDRGWFTRVLPLVVAGTAGLVAIGWVAVSVLQPFPDPLPIVVWWSLGAVLLAVGLAAAAARRPGWTRRTGAAVAAVLVLAAAGNAVNTHFGQFPTVGAALGLPPANQVDFAQVSTGAADVVARQPGRPLSQVWQPPPGMPSAGTVSEVAIPAPVSGFAARPAWVYLPPAHLTVPRAQLPVLVLLSGQPGSPRDWLDGGGLSAMMDRFAASHGGLAPVVVMPDWLGAPFTNTLCLDSRLGAVQTYLTVDVPAWVRATLQVDPDPASWAVGGLSAGGTCALQLAVNAPQTFPTFVDVSGQSEPTLGDRARTVAAAFGGDAAAFASVNPLELLAARSYPGSAGTVVVGSGDSLFRPQAQQVADAARRAGMQIEYRELPGGHDWRVWAPGLETSLPWLATRTGLTP